MTRVLASLIFLSTLSAANVALAQNDCGIYPDKTVTTLLRGGRVDWSKTHGLIAYDVLPDPEGEGRDSYFQVRVMRLEGATVAEDYCLTCGVQAQHRALRKHKGNPAWHPSGEYIVFQALSPDGDALDKITHPGRGVDNVLWLADRQGTRFWQLTWPSASARGVLHPHFSAEFPDGVRLSWSEMYAPGDADNVLGYWRLKVAKLKFEGNRPYLDLDNAETYQPGMAGFYENHGFSPDGARLIFSSNLARSGPADGLNNDIFTVDRVPGAPAIRHTDERYNEHAHYTPRGTKILWVTNRGNLNLGTDLWIMPSGSTDDEGERVTAFNKRNCPDFARRRVVAADSSTNAAGDKVVLYAQDQILGDVGSILLIEFRSPLD